jgi:CheY-like chemotaxis protein
VARTIIAVVDDLFFASKIRATADELGVEVRFVRRPEALISGASEKTPELIIVDLESEKVDAYTLAGELKANDYLRDVPLVGFFSHVLTEVKLAAIESGFDTVVPRSVFTRDLAKILAG